MKLTVRAERAETSRISKVAKDKLEKDLCRVKESLNFHDDKLASTSAEFERKLQLARDELASTSSVFDRKLQLAAEEHLENKRKMKEEHQKSYAIWCSKSEDKKRKLTNAVKKVADQESLLQSMQTKMNLATEELKEQLR